MKVRAGKRFSRIERENMTRAIYVLAACLAVGCAGCFTWKDADGKGSRKFIVPALTIVTTRADEKGEARTMTILPLTYVQKSLTSPEGVKTESWAVALIATAWEKKTDAAGLEDKELLIVPLLTYYHKQTTAATGAETVPMGSSFKEDYQTVWLLTGFHRTSKEGTISSWGYLNILFDYVRSGDNRTVKIFHIIPVPFSSGKKPAVSGE